MNLPDLSEITRSLERDFSNGFPATGLVLPDCCEVTDNLGEAVVLSQGQFQDPEIVKGVYDFNKLHDQSMNWWEGVKEWLIVYGWHLSAAGHEISMVCNDHPEIELLESMAPFIERYRLKGLVSGLLETLALVKLHRMCGDPDDFVGHLLDRILCAGAIPVSTSDLQGTFAGDPRKNCRDERLSILRNVPTIILAYWPHKQAPISETDDIDPIQVWPSFEDVIPAKE